jgi:hypothetical protein
VDPAELAFMVVLIVVLLATAGYFGWHQVRTLRGANPAGVDERRYAVRQAWRRLFCCGLMVLVAVLLIGWFFLDPGFRELHARAQSDPLTEGDKDFTRFMAVYWGLVLVAVFALLALAAADSWAIARFGLRQRRRLQEDHRAQLEEQLARLRQQRNGHE